MEEILDRWLAWGVEKAQLEKRPVVSLCYAQSLDGSLTARAGEPLLLSGPQSLEMTHRLRAAQDAILVGIGTILSDNPSLTVRLVAGASPQPVILDGGLALPMDAKVLRHPLHPWVATRAGQRGETYLEKKGAIAAAGAQILELPTGLDEHIDLRCLLSGLFERGVRSLMVEGGARVLTSFLMSGLVDRVSVTIAPVYIGGLPIAANLSRAMEAGRRRLVEVEYQPAGRDLLVWGRMG